MKRKMIKIISAITITLLLSLSAVGCTNTQVDSGNAVTTEVTSSTTSVAEDSVLDTSELFSDRDLEQSVDRASATQIKLESDKDVTLNTEGIYVLSGEVKNVTIVVDAPEDAKIQIVLDGVSITNEDSPAIYVKAADKVFVTSTDSKNHMEVSGTYVADGDTNLDAVIFSKADITLNGTGTLEIVSTKGNGISSKDDIKITGGVYNINSSGDAIEANNIKINGGEITLYAKNDGINATPKVNDNVAIEVNGGTINVTMGSGDTDAFDSNGDIYINGGTIVIEATSAFDSDGTAELNGGNVTVNGETITQITQTQMGGGGKRK